MQQTLKKKFFNDGSGWFVPLASGAVSSTCGQLAAYPLTLVRTKLQAKGNSIFDYVCVVAFMKNYNGI